MAIRQSGEHDSEYIDGFFFVCTYVWCTMYVYAVCRYGAEKCCCAMVESNAYIVDLRLDNWHKPTPSHPMECVFVRARVHVLVIHVFVFWQLVPFAECNYRHNLNCARIYFYCSHRVAIGERICFSLGWYESEWKLLNPTHSSKKKL